MRTFWLRHCELFAKSHLHSAHVRKQSKRKNEKKKKSAARNRSKSRSTYKYICTNTQWLCAGSTIDFLFCIRELVAALIISRLAHFFRTLRLVGMIKIMYIIILIIKVNKVLQTLKAQYNNLKQIIIFLCAFAFGFFFAAEKEAKLLPQLDVVV